MSDKQKPLGICDLCGERFPAGVSLYTRRGPRRYCSVECRNTANSRVGAPVRARKARERVASGEWFNPSPFTRPGATDAQRAALVEKMRRSVSRARRREVAEGRWRNPALDDAAREKLSRPRIHADNPLLHSAIEKLRRGAAMSELSQDEAEIYRTYRRERRERRIDEIRAWYRARYRRLKNNDC